MSVYSLKSDNEFICPFTDKHLSVYLYNCTDMNWYWKHQADVGPKVEKYKALEVFGTTIKGDRFKELCRELIAIEEAGLDLYVNRLGLRMINRIGNIYGKPMRIDDYFDWSYYGVKVPHQFIISTSEMWSMVDKFNGEMTMHDSRGLVRTEGGDEELRRSLEEKNVELATCKKELEEKSMEITALKKELELKTCKKELEWSKKMESLLISKLVEEKDKVINELMMKNQLLALRGDDH